MMRLRPSILLCAVLAWLLAGTSAARPPGGPHGPPPDRMIERHAERLGLDAEQLAAIRRVADASAAERDAVAERLDEARSEMRALLSAADPDGAAVDAQAEAIGAIELELHKLRLRSMLEIRGMLTAEQRAELVKIREEMKQGGRGRGRFGPFGPCGRDLEAMCPESERGRAALQCLDTRWDELSDRCRTFLEEGRRGRFGPGGPGRRSGPPPEPPPEPSPL